MAGKTKVPNLEDALPIDEDVGRFEVKMDEGRVVNVLDTLLCVSSVTSAAKIRLQTYQ